MSRHRCITERCERMHWRNGGCGWRRAQTALTCLLVFSAGVTADRLFWQDGGTIHASTSVADRPEFKTLQATWDLIHEEWPAPSTIDDPDLMYGAAAGMMDALKDTGHSRFLKPAAAKDFEDAMRGEFTGVGIEIDFRGERPFVLAPIDESPADEAGIRSGDTILTIDGRPTDRLDWEELSELIRGEAGTSVTLELLHRGDTTPYTVTIVRRKITLQPVSWRTLPYGIVHLRLAEFSVGTTQKLKVALDEMRASGATGIILDLRDNPGGLVAEAIGVASQFMVEGATIYHQQERDGVANPVNTVGLDGRWLDRPLVVLINGGSASAAEIVGAALRDNGRAMLLGEQTFGTGTVVTPYQQPDGSIVLLGTALWLTADNVQLWNIGVTPDRVIPLPFDVVPSRPRDDPEVTSVELAAIADTQLRAAFDAVIASTGSSASVG